MPCASCGDAGWQNLAFRIALAQSNRDWKSSQPLPGLTRRAARQAARIRLRYGVTQDVMTPGINERCVLLESGVASSSSLNVRDRFGDLPF
jgi:hypothetical protein